MSVGVERAAHRRARVARRPRRARAARPRSAARCSSAGEHLGAALAADLDDEAVAVARRAARSARGRSRRSTRGPVSIDDAEARAAGARAVDGDEERVARGAPRSRRRRSGRRGRRGPGSRRRAGRTSARRRTRSAAAPRAARPRASPSSPRRARQIAQLRREQEALERVVPDGVREERLVVAALQAVACRRPARRPSPPGRSAALRQLVVDDRLRAHASGRRRCSRARAARRRARRARSGRRSRAQRPSWPTLHQPAHRRSATSRGRMWRNTVAATAAADPVIARQSRAGEPPALVDFPQVPGALPMQRPRAGIPSIHGP